MVPCNYCSEVAMLLDAQRKDPAIRVLGLTRQLFMDIPEKLVSLVSSFQLLSTFCMQLFCKFWYNVVLFGFSSCVLLLLRSGLP